MTISRYRVASMRHSLFEALRYIIMEDVFNITSFIFKDYLVVRNCLDKGDENVLACINFLLLGLLNSPLHRWANLIRYNA